MSASWLPLAIELIRGWAKTGEPKGDDIANLFAALSKMDHDDLRTLGCNMQIAGVAIQEIAANLKAAAEIRKVKELAAEPAD